MMDAQTQIGEDLDYLKTLAEEGRGASVLASP
jgi:hypothetical protein